MPNTSVTVRSLHYLLTLRSRVLLEKLTGFQLVKKFSAFYGTRRFIITFNVPSTCPYPEPARSLHTPTPHFLKFHLNIIPPFTLKGPYILSVINQCVCVCVCSFKGLHSAQGNHDRHCYSKGTPFGGTLG